MSNLNLFIMRFFRSLHYLLISAFVLVGMQNISAQELEMPQISNENDLALSGYGYYGYGTISGAGKIYMEFEFCDGALCGKYYYLKTNKNRKNKAWIRLFGSWDNSYVTLEESGNGRKNGYFSGYFDNNGVYSGTFYRNDGKTFSFRVNLKSNI